ncbi:MAG: repressor LexA [Geobacteraceae bacterium GWC2_53_11]|nr:MAG: repressor LexA [Geobacteraceae bacterium GWC2_53_11]
MQPLTERQRKVLDFITSNLDTNGCPPTLREISSHIATKGTATAIAHLEALERKGYIVRRSGSRGIAIPGRTTIPVSVPIVGTIRAGIPEPTIEDLQGYCSIDPNWLKGVDCYLLKVKGDSMIDAHILDGDLALIRPQPTADNGEIVVAMIDGEATLKRFYRESGHIRLQPENSSMKPIIIKDGEADTVIAGKLLRTIRSYE